MQIPLKHGLVALVDDSDAALVSGLRWVARVRKQTGRPYSVIAKKNGKCILLHRLICGLGPGRDIFVDHINGDVLDNRRQNLRLATNAQNLRNRKMHKNNTTGFKGVHRRKNGNFEARIKMDHRCHYVGTFKTAEAAHDAYCKKARELHGEFARFA